MADTAFANDGSHFCIGRKSNDRDRLHQSENPQCEATEQELAKLGVRYDTVDLTKNPSTFEQIKNAGFKQIPVVISPNSSWSGHRPDLIRQLAQSFAA